MFKHYTMNQVVLPIDLAVKLPKNDIAFSVNEIVESIPQEAFNAFVRQAGCTAYHPRMMWLAQGYEPTYRTINRFRVNPAVQELLRQCFVQFRCQLVQEGLIEDEAIFIDETKIEANANKFTFVWRKSIEKYSAALIEKSNQMYDELLEKEIIPGIERESLEELSDAELLQVAEQLDEVIAEYDQEISTTEAGSERNSYSKTDKDATFMRMKDDYMKNGQLKAGYNVRVATEGQYALAYDIYPNPTDTCTLMPFLDTIEEKFFSLPGYTVADAGYGKEQNYGDILDNRASTHLITYNTYHNEKQKKYRNNPFNSSNWDYDEKEDAFTCPNG